MLLKLESGLRLINLAALYYPLCLLLLVNANAEKIEDRNQVVCNYNDLKVGQEIPIYFGSEFNSKIPSLLPKEKADLIPFSSQKLPFLLEYFGFFPKSPQAEAMESTLKLCERMTSVPGDLRICATSMDSMLEFVRKVFNSSSNSNSNGGLLKLLSTSPLAKGSKLLQKYTILEKPQQIPSPKIVECHMLTYPYAVYLCYHFPEPEDNQVFKISLRGEDGGYVDAIANCLINTSTWNPNDGALRILGLKPGGSPVCQFLPSTDLLWVRVTVDSKERYGNQASTTL